MPHHVGGGRVAPALLGVAGGAVRAAVRAVLAAHRRSHRAAAVLSILERNFIISQCHQSPVP